MTMPLPVFEKVLEDVGDSGRHQHLLFWLFVVPINFILPWVALAPIFMTSKPDHWCHVPGRPASISMDEWKNLTIPRDPSGDGKSFSKCTQYNVSWYDFSNVDLTSNITDLAAVSHNAHHNIIGCQSGWDYDRTDYDSTLTTQQNWVCERDSLGATWQSVGVAGNVLGTLVFNSLSDIYGRRPVFVVASLVFAIFGMLRYHVTSTIWIMITMFLANTSFPSTLELALIIVLEQVSPGWRARITSTSFILWTSGMSLLPLIAWLSRDWVILGYITTIPFFFVLPAWWLLPESPRWQLSRKKLKEAVDSLRGIAKRNGRSVPEDLDQTVQGLAMAHHGESNYGVIQLFAYPTVRLRTILLTLCYTCNNLFYYGLAYNTANMNGNEFVNFFLLSITELPGNLLGWLSAEIIGRRWTQAGCCILAGLFALSTVFLLSLPGWISIMMLIISKVFVTMSFMVVYVQCAEIYPTTHRAAGTGFSSLISSIFGTTAPYIAYIAVHGSWLPYVVLFCITVVGYWAASFLPETLDADLPQSLQDADNFLTSEKYFSYKGRQMASGKVAITPNTSEKLGQVNYCDADNIKGE